MHLRTLFLYLIGNRRAILEIASSRQALWLGGLFVLSAGFAREYDGEDLLHEPWHLLIPFGASLLASVLIFSIAYGIAIRNSETTPPFFSAYRSFLCLFWMTAPLAWLYAIPYERFLSPADAMRANLWTLAVVALWRVVLTIRVLTVLMNFRVVWAFFLVMVFADGLLLAAMMFVPVPLVDIMGGIRLSESDTILRATKTIALGIGSCSLPIWIVGAIVACIFSKPAWQASRFTESSGNGPATRSQGWGLWILAWVSVAIWVFILPFTQSEQQMRYRVDQFFKEGQIGSALEVMSSHEQKDFPPYWEPPPRYVQLNNDVALLLTICEEIAKTEQASWVRELYLEKFRLSLNRFRWDEPNLPRVGRLLQQLPEGQALVENYSRQYSYDKELIAKLRAFLDDPNSKSERKSDDKPEE